MKGEKKKHLRCHYCIEDCVFEASKWVWKLFAVFTLSRQPVLLPCLLEFDFKNQQYLGQNQSSSTKPHLKKTLEFVALVLAYDVQEIGKIWRNSVKFALKVTHGNSQRKWVVVFILLLPQKPVWWNDIVSLTELDAGGQNHSRLPDWVGRRAECVEKIMHNKICVTLVLYSREITTFFVSQGSGLVKNFIIGIYSDAINVINANLCLMVLLI